MQVLSFSIKNEIAIHPFIFCFGGISNHNEILARFILGVIV